MKTQKTQEAPELIIPNRHVFRETYLAAIGTALIPTIEILYNKNMAPENRKTIAADRVKYTTGHLKGGTILGRMPAETHIPSDPTRQIELMVRIDQDDPVFIAKLIWHQMMHILTTAEHGQEFKAATEKCGGMFEKGKGLRGILPGPDFVDEHIVGLIANLGPYPHRALNYAELERKSSQPAPDGEANELSEQDSSPDAKKPQKGRQRSAKCSHPGCEFKLQLSRQAAQIGPPCCYLHGPMEVELKDGDNPLPSPDPTSAFWWKPKTKRSAAPDEAMDAEFREVGGDAKSLPAPDLQVVAE